MEAGATERPALKSSPEAIRLVSCETMLRHKLAPLELCGNVLRVAAVNPNDFPALDDLRLRTGYELKVVKVSQAELTEIVRCAARSGEEGFRRAELEVPKGHADDSFAVQAVDRLLDLALNMRASDIHLEPQRSGLFVRFRVDGVLNTIHEFPKGAQAGIISRVKVMSGMDISEKRLPGDGQMSVERYGRNIDLRISTLPAKYGEKAVIRVLDKSGLSISLDTLGLQPDVQSVFEAMIENPYGIILVTGPTGSGKTTTLYSVLGKIRSPLKNVITLEDPIEYELLGGSASEMGITQVQVHPKIGLTFAAGLRASLRQDPDVIMVGEIRDRETAETAMTAAMTGHLVLSTLHTNDAPSALGRMLDMGIEPYLMSSTVVGILAQRLLRLLCPDCREKYQPPLRALKNMFPGRQGLEKAVFYRAKGCDRCNGSGYLGRRGIFELLAMTEELKRIIHGGAGLESIRKELAVQGFKTLRESGMELVFQGLTTVEEVARVAAEQG